MQNRLRKSLYLLCDIIMLFMPKKTIFAIILVLLMAVCVGYLFLVRNKTVEVEVVEVQRKDLVEFVSASGEITACEQTTVFAPLTGTINEIKVTQGQKVTKNDILAIYDKMPFLQVYYKADAAHITAKLAQEQLNELSPTDIAKDKAQAHLDAAFNAFQNAQIDLAKTEIKALITGTIIFEDISSFALGAEMQKIEQGASVNIGQKLFTIANTQKFCLDAQVDETDISKISLNQEVEVSIDALESDGFTGKVSFIAPSSSKSTEGETVYKVKIDIEKTNMELKLGLTGDANFILAKQENVLVVPFEAVLQEDEEAHVFVVVDNKLAKRQISLGKEVDGEWEITSGLSENETVVVENAAKLKTGQRVK